MAAVLAGGEDDKLFAAAEEVDEEQADLEAAVDAKAEAEAGQTSGAPAVPAGGHVAAPASCAMPAPSHGSAARLNPHPPL